MSNPVLRVRGLSVAFGFDKNGNPRDGVKPVQVTDRVSFEINAGEFFALVGESGCGKSVTAMGILRLLPWPGAQIVEGSVLFHAGRDAAGASNAGKDCAEGSLVGKDCAPIDLAKLPLPELQKIRGSEIACIFQEPMQALNPVVTIKKQLLEVFRFCVKADAGKDGAVSAGKADAGKDGAADPLAVIREMLTLAGFNDPDRVLNAYPHELSGGMLQRVCIVMALLPKPRLIIADEPTTALDVTVQAQVLAVLKDMANRTGTAVLLITHNMGIVSQYADRVAVMYAGRIVECGPVRDVIDNPMHPYTQGLLAAIPENHSDMRNLRSIPGSVPHARDFVKGCRFADRCEKCASLSAELQAKCRSQEIPPKVGESHFAQCYFQNLQSK
ncbi:peptide/nickel transport system ATP-binding protein/oligopeptide transport system ATP-binding protein [Fibrobacter sp. UWCM]|uniref:ABC transporter ATP-binding protein n=1 Tax=Fibrobacter sp. UWCM TaxID=1896208 RepID=UPI000913E6F3|nr:ABC transporter ATP-binding protein [Fibrobacter sp. UWCM]SHG93585.1 peptide/nickel transport system ATP-binding protein/oligopeptide transport system ATP-binding protein [Fibrobacter sp. UWCM]